LVKHALKHIKIGWRDFFHYRHFKSSSEQICASKNRSRKKLFLQKKYYEKFSYEVLKKGGKGKMEKDD